MWLDYLLGGWQLLLTPGLRKRLTCLCRRAWFCWFPAQKFCRNWWASFMMSCMRRSSPWKRNVVVLCARLPFLQSPALFPKLPSRMGSAAAPGPQRAPPCSAATSAAASCSSCPRGLLGRTACWAAAGSGENKGINSVRLNSLSAWRRCSYDN